MADHVPSFASSSVRRQPASPGLPPLYRVAQVFNLRTSGGGIIVWTYLPFSGITCSVGGLLLSIASLSPTLISISAGGLAP